MIIRNFEIIKLMTDIAKGDDLAFLSPSLAPDICYRDDSSHSSQSVQARHRLLKNGRPRKEKQE